MNRGIAYATLSYIAWGLFPIYFKALGAIPPFETLMNRMVWSLGFLALLLAARGHWTWLAGALREPRVIARFALSAIVLSINWGVYIWAVSNDHVVDASLGYFINPLVNVVLARVILKERLRIGQWAAVALAALGVIWLTWQAGHPPWIGITLGLSFGTYGVLRKTGTLGALEGLSLETLLLFPFAVVVLVWMSVNGVNHFGSAPVSTRWLLVAAGPITAIPLLLFAAGARRIPFSLLGLLQYVSPTIQLVLGVWLYKESFDSTKLLGYCAIWLALLAYWLESVVTNKRLQPRWASAS